MANLVSPVLHFTFYKYSHLHCKMEPTCNARWRLVWWGGCLVWDYVSGNGKFLPVIHKMPSYIYIIWTQVETKWSICCSAGVTLSQGFESLCIATIARHTAQAGDNNALHITAIWRAALRAPCSQITKRSLLPLLMHQVNPPRKPKE